MSQHLCAEAFATVGSDVKKQILVRQCLVAEDHIFYNRDTSFAKGMMRMTKGRGVDDVINSLAVIVLLLPGNALQLARRTSYPTPTYQCIHPGPMRA